MTTRLHLAPAAAGKTAAILGRFTTAAQVAQATALIAAAVGK